MKNKGATENFIKRVPSVTMYEDQISELRKNSPETLTLYISFVIDRVARNNVKIDDFIEKHKKDDEETFFTEVDK